MKKVLIVAVLTAESFAGFTQDKTDAKPLSFSAGIEGNLPIGDIATGIKFSDASNFGVGLYAQGAYKVADEMAITFHAGYTSFMAKEDGFDDVTVIPVLAGIKYHFNEKFYAAGQLGVSFISNFNDDSQTAFTYAPGIGYQLSKFDLSLNYTGRSFKIDETSCNMSSIGLRVAYCF